MTGEGAQLLHDRILDPEAKDHAHRRHETQALSVLRWCAQKNRDRPDLHPNVLRHIRDIRGFDLDFAEVVGSVEVPIAKLDAKERQGESQEEHGADGPQERRAELDAIARERVHPRHRES